MGKERLVVVGNGMAAFRLLRELSRLDAGRFEITVLGAEAEPAYNRILLSQVVSGEAQPADLRLADRRWYERNGVQLLTGTPAIGIDRHGRTVTALGGKRTPYGKLVIATGSLPIVLPLPGAGLPGVFQFRDLSGTERLLRRVRPGARAVVIGGGLLGLEVASGMAKRGMAVTVVHLLDTLMERQLDGTGSGVVRRALERLGVSFLMPAKTAAILGERWVQGVRLEDGTVLDADVVLMAVGIRPNVALAAQAGLACRQGIVVDDVLATSDPAIYALGECTEHRGRTYGLVAPLYQQAEVCARHLLGDADARYVGSVLSTSLKVSGVDVFSAGEFGDGSGGVLFYRDLTRGVYRRLTMRGNRLAGAVLCGETLDGPWYGDLIRAGSDLGGVRDQLIHGRAFVEAAHRAQASSAQEDLPPDVIAPAADRFAGVAV